MSGDLRIDSRLPSLRFLAASFGVSLPTMHAAVHALVALGFLRVRHGAGTFVAKPRDRAAVLNYAWLRASEPELATIRSILDERLAHAAARAVAESSRIRIPAALGLIHFLAYEREGNRHLGPVRFLKADAAFHRAVATSLRGFEMLAEVRERVDARLTDAFLGVADVLAIDEDLQSAHVALAGAVMDGHPFEAARHARRVATREAEALQDTLG